MVVADCPQGVPTLVREGDSLSGKWRTMVT